jgi:hypothetical protein
MTTAKQLRHEQKKVRRGQDGSEKPSPMEVVGARVRYRCHRLDGSIEHRRMASAPDVVQMLGGLIFFRVDVGGGVSEYIEALNAPQARMLFKRHQLACVESER